MSTYITMTKLPGVDEPFKPAVWVDDYYGRNHYGVKFVGEKEFLDPHEIAFVTDFDMDMPDEISENFTTIVEEATKGWKEGDTDIQVGSLVYVDNKGFVYEVFELSGDKACISNCSANARVEVNVDRLTIAKSAEEYSNNLKRYREFFQGEKVETPTMQEVEQLIDEKFKEAGIVIAGNPKNPTPRAIDKPVYTDEHGNQAEIELKEYKRWRAEEGDVFYTVYTHGRIGEEVEYSEHADNMKYAMGNYFETKKLAFAHKEKLLAEQEFKDLVMKYNEGWEADWEDSRQEKYFIEYDHNNNEWSHNTHWFLHSITQTYMSKEAAEKILENHQDLLNKLI